MSLKPTFRIQCEKCRRKTESERERVRVSILESVAKWPTNVRYVYSVLCIGESTMFFEWICLSALCTNEYYTCVCNAHSIRELIHFEYGHYQHSIRSHTHSVYLISYSIYLSYCTDPSTIYHLDARKTVRIFIIILNWGNRKRFPSLFQVRSV